MKAFHNWQSRKKCGKEKWLQEINRDKEVKKFIFIGSLDQDKSLSLSCFMWESYILKSL